MRATLLIATLLLATTMAGCTDDGPSEIPVWQAPVIAEAGCHAANTVALTAPEPTVVFETNFGTIEAKIFQELVPVTATNFLNLVEDGFYDGTKFHRVITDFMMQGGDPEGTGRGGPGYDIPDEFHHRLRHDRAGLLSMANSGPNTGGSQFFITFAPTTWLDDKHSIFGEVTSGMDIVQKVNADASSSGGTPRTPVTLESARVIAAGGSSAMEAGFGLVIPDAQQIVGSDGGKAGFIVVVENCSDHLVQTTLSATTSVGTANVEIEAFELPGAQRKVVLVTTTLPAGSGDATLTITADGGGASTSITATVVRDGQNAPTVALGDGLEAHYIGMLEDGRLFDTSLTEVAESEFIAKSGTFSARARGSPFGFAPGSGVIQGFTDIAVGTQAGGTSVGRIAPADAYGVSGQSPLAGRTLIFSLEVADLKG